MNVVSIRIDPAGFDGMVRQLGRMQVAIPRAIALGLNEGGDKVRTQVIAALVRQTGVSKKQSVTSRIRTSRAFGEGDRITGDVPANMRSASTGAALTYQIIATGKGIPIREFPVKVVAGPGGYVDAKSWGVDHLFKRSFALKGGGANPYRARLPGSGRFPMRGLYGPSLPKELGKDASATTFYLASHAFVGEAIIKQLARVL